MSTSSAARTIAETEALLAEVDRHEREDADAARRAERSRPDPGANVPGLPQELVQQERRAILGVLPRKSLWPEFEEYNQRGAELQGRQLDVENRLRGLQEQRVNAPSADAQAAADWETAGRQGPRPDPTADRIDAEIADADRERDGLLAAIDRALEDRGRFVEQNRDRLASVAAQQSDTLLARIVELLDEAEQARATLAELRQAEIWARLFPHELANREPMTRLFGGGLRQVAESVGITVQIEHARMIDALRADALWLRHAAATNDQRALLEGRDPREAKGGAWTDTDEYRAEREAEIEVAGAAFRQEWGRDPTEAQLVAFIEARRGNPS